MSCIECEKVQEAGDIAYFRWDIATVGLIGCDKHLQEIMTVLRDNQVSNQPIYRVLNKPVKTERIRESGSR